MKASDILSIKALHIFRLRLKLWEILSLSSLKTVKKFSLKV